MSLLCTVYRSPLREEMYLYVEKKVGLRTVPEPLLQKFGEPEEVLSLILEPQRKLARADAETVLENIREHGFYLQMPPVVFQSADQDAD